MFTDDEESFDVLKFILIIICLLITILFVAAHVKMGAEKTVTTHHRHEFIKCDVHSHTANEPHKHSKWENIEGGYPYKVFWFIPSNFEYIQDHPIDGEGCP